MELGYVDSFFLMWRLIISSYVFEVRVSLLELESANEVNLTFEKLFLKNSKLSAKLVAVKSFKFKLRNTCQRILPLQLKAFDKNATGKQQSILC